MLPESFSKGEAKRRWQQIWQRTKVHQHLRNLAQVLLQVGLESPSNEVHRGCWWKIRGAPKTTTRALSLIEALSWAAQVKYQHTAAKNWTARSFFPSRYFSCNSNPSARCQRDMRAAAVIRPFQAGSFLRCSSLPIAPMLEGTMKVTWMDSPKHKFVVHMSSSRKHRHFLHMLLAALSWNAWETYLKESVLKLVAHIPSPFSPALRMLWANQTFRGHSIRTQKAHRRSITQPRSIKHVVKPAVRSK